MNDRTHVPTPDLDEAAVSRRADLLDLAVDFATLGEYGVEAGKPGRNTGSGRAAACHRVSAGASRRRLDLSIPDERVRPGTAAGRRRLASGARPGLGSLELQRRLGSGASGRAGRARTAAAVRPIGTAPSLRKAEGERSSTLGRVAGTGPGGRPRRSGRQAPAGQLQLAVTA